VRCGRLLRELRLREGLGQAELARLSGTEQPAISRIERDAVSPRIETLNKVLEAMGETIVISTRSLREPPPLGGNQSIAELRADYRELSPEERLAQAARLTEIATGLAAESSG
jgi:transcriptional regulator with XRE-family HTH domain